MNPAPNITQSSKRLTFGTTNNLCDETWHNMNENFKTMCSTDHKMVHEPLKTFVLDVDMAWKAGSIEFKHDFVK